MAQLDKGPGIGCLFIPLSILALPDKMLMTCYDMLVKIALKRYTVILTILIIIF